MAYHAKEFELSPASDGETWNFLQGHEVVKFVFKEKQQYDKLIQER